MKKRSYIKFIIVNILTLPLRILAYIWSLVLYIHYRALPTAVKLVGKIESHEKAYKVKRK